MSTGLFMSKMSNNGPNSGGGQKFNTNAMIKNSITFSIQKPTKSFIGVSHSKSSSDVNSITGNLSSNYASSAAFVNAQNLAAETNYNGFKNYITPSSHHSNSNSNSNNKPHFSKIPKSISTSGIKQSKLSNEIYVPHNTCQKKRKFLTILSFFYVASKKRVYWSQADASSLFSIFSSCLFIR